MRHRRRFAGLHSPGLFKSLFPQSLLQLPAFLTVPMHSSFFKNNGKEEGKQPEEMGALNDGDAHAAGTALHCCLHLLAALS